MLFEKEFKDGKFVSSKDEFCFAEVVEDFKNAKKIGIITYNISSRANDVLLEYLEETSDETDIQIITNIPSRFETYFNDKVRKNAKSSIKIYLDKLDPSNFNNKIQTYFNFCNHAKIIVTDNVIYWGSSNFSNESKFNYEVGVITRDKTFIEYIFNEYFEHIKNNSIPYYDDDYNELKLNAYRLRVILKSHYELFKYELLNYNEQYNRYYFNRRQNNYSEDNYDELYYIVEQWEDLRILIENIDFEEYDIEDSIYKLLSIYESICIDNLKVLVSYGKFYDFITTNLDNLYDEKFEEYSLEAYDEHLDYYVEKAYDEALEELFNMGDECETLMANAVEDFENLINTLNTIIDYIEGLSNKVVLKEIDNT